MQVQDLSYLVQAMGNDLFSQRYRKLSQGLCQVWNNPESVHTGLQFFVMPRVYARLCYHGAECNDWHFLDVTEEAVAYIYGS